MLASFLDGADLTNVILVLGVVGVAIKSIGEGRGWFRSAASLRVENTDLIRRNSELEATVARHEATIAANVLSIQDLTSQVKLLEKLDQSAVLAALKDHELGAETRAKRTHDLQAESTDILNRIATVLEAAA